MYAIEATGLHKRFGAHAAVRGLTLNVPENCIYGFLGPNGAGKTAAMRLLLGLLAQDEGTVRLLGHDIRHARIAALRNVGAFIETPSLYDHLSGRTNLDLTRCMLDLPAREVDRVLEIVDLRDAAGRRVGGYSLGMKQRLALARALLGSPRLLLLDEPTNGLDADGIIAMRALIRDLPARIGGTVFMASHMLSEVEQIASVVGLMNAGSLALEGDVRALLGDGRTLRAIVDDPPRARAVLAHRGVELLESDADVVSFRLPAGDPVREAASINRCLVEAGLGVSALTYEARSLETVYRDAVAARQPRGRAE